MRIPAGRLGVVWNALVAWLGLALLSSTQGLIEQRTGKPPVAWSAALASALVYWALWLPIAPGISKVASHLAIGAPWRRGVALLGGATAASGAHTMLRLTFSRMTGWEGERSLGELLRSHFWLDTTIAALALLSVSWWRAKREAREAREAQARLEVRLAEARHASAKAELQIVRSQLQPHFLLNTLQGITALARTDPDRAESMGQVLGELLRDTLYGPGEGLVSLREELGFIERYVALERMRYGDRLRFQVCMERGAGEARLPARLLQPLVENAIRHGVAPVAAGGSVAVGAATTDTALIIRIWNTHPTLRLTRAGGLGLRATQAILDRTYGGRATLAIDHDVRGGTEVTLTVPSAPESNA